MEIPPLTRDYFSSAPGKEYFCRLLYWLLLITFVLVLYIFWDPLRSTGFTYSLVSITMIDPAIAFFFLVVTAMGSEEFFLALFSVGYWSVNKSLAFWGLVITPLSLLITSEIPKDIIRLPRPDVRGVSLPTYTFPSGHTSGAVSVWGYLAVRLKSPWLWVCALLIVSLVGLSRVMLGYHFPGDVLGGAVTGMFFLAVWLCLGNKAVERNFGERASFWLLLSAALILPLAMSFIPAKSAPHLMGYLAGAGVGYLLQREMLDFPIRGKWQQHLARATIGLTILAGIILGLNLILPEGIHLLTFARYALGTFWVTYLAPLLFVKLNL